MKKISIFSILTLLIILIFGCTVNSTTGVIKIKNMSYKEVTNIKIGGTIICLYLAPGNSYDYYFYSNITGKLKANGATTRYNGNYSLDIGEWYECDIEKDNDKNYIYLGMHDYDEDFYEE